MSGLIDIIAEDAPYIMLAIILLLLILCGISIYILVYIMNMKKKYDYFMQKDFNGEKSLEEKIEEYLEHVEKIDDKYTRLALTVKDIDKNMSQCIQKIGIVRYNPFEEMGGNLCFAIALLDNDDNGIVLNGIHSRTGSFVYAKPIELGTSIYILSDEEDEALGKALGGGYKSIDRNIIVSNKSKSKQYKVFMRKEKDLVPTRKCVNKNENVDNVILSKGLRKYEEYKPYIEKNQIENQNNNEDIDPQLEYENYDQYTDDAESYESEKKYKNSDEEEIEKKSLEDFDGIEIIETIADHGEESILSADEDEKEYKIDTSDMSIAEFDDILPSVAEINEETEEGNTYIEKIFAKEQMNRAKGIKESNDKKSDLDKYI